MPRVLFDDDGDSIDTVNSNKVGLNNQSTVNKNVQTKHRSKEDSKRILFDSDEEDPDESNHPGTSDQLTINKIYAESYDVWRRKEDYQKLKDKYGEESDSDDSDTSDDDGFAEPDNPEFDMDFFRTLAAIRTNHPILKEKENFFKSSYESKSKKVESKEKPITVKDFERKLLLEREGKYDEEEEEEDLTYKKRFVFENIPTQSQKITFDDNLSDGDEDLFEKKTKPSQKESEDEQEPENEALEFLKGKKSTLKDETDTQLLSSLKKDWETDMSAEDKYLMDYFVNQRYLEEEDENVSRDPHHRPLDIEPLEDDEETYEKMESYETKYRFRFEEPDEEFIRRYPRKTDDAVRKDDEKRKQEREKKKKLENDKEEQRKQEMLRLKAWKKKEIMERINELEEASGKKMAFDDLDLNEDFDPDQHDAAMSKMFDENYYGESESKPNFQDDEIEQELMDEYKKLEDLDSMTEGSFRYVDVFASSFGLTTEEILYAKDTELNRWYSMKKILNVNLPESKEKMYSTSYIKRANTDTIKKRILPSLFTEDLEDQWKAEEERKRKRNEKKKERRVRKMKKEEEEKSKEDQESEEVKDEIKEDQDEEMEYSDNENLEDEVNSSIDNLNIKNKVKKKRKSSDTNESIHKIKHEVKKERKIKQDQEENEIEDSGDESQDNEDKVNSSLDNLNIKKKRKLSDTNETIQIIKQEVNEQQVKERKIKHEIKEEQNEKIEDSDNESHEDEVSSSSCNLKSKNKKKRKLSDSSETIQIIKQEVNEQQIKQVKERKIKHEIKEQNEKLEDSDKETLEDEVSSSSCNLKSKTEKKQKKKKRKLSDSSETKHKIKQEVKEEHETIEDTDNINQENEEETINSCNIKNEKQKKKKRKSSGTDEITGVEDVQKTTKIVQKDKNKNYQNKNTSSINKDKTIKGKLKGDDHSNTRLNHSNAKPKRKEFEVTKSHNSKFEHKQNKSNKLKRKNPQNFKPDDERVKGISDSRLAAYGANPKKIKRFLQYGKK